MIRLVLLLLPMWCCAQSNYAVLSDSMVSGIHYQDVQRWAVGRVAQNLATHNAILEIGALNGQLAGLHKAVEMERQGKATLRTAWDKCEAGRAALQVDCDAWKEKAQRRNKNALLYTLAGLCLGAIITR